MLQLGSGKAPPVQNGTGIGFTGGFGPEVRELNYPLSPYPSGPGRQPFRELKQLALRERGLQPHRICEQHTIHGRDCTFEIEIGSHVQGCLRAGGQR